MSEALQKIVNAQAIRKAEQQYRLAQLFTPYGFEAERQDYDRVAAFLHTPRRAFPQPTDGIASSLARIEASLHETDALLSAFEAQGLTPQLDADKLYVTAKANVTGQRGNTAAYHDAAA